MVRRSRVTPTVLWFRFGRLCGIADRLGNFAAWHIRLDDGGRSRRGRGGSHKWWRRSSGQNGTYRGGRRSPFSKHRRRKFRTSDVFLLRDAPFRSEYLRKLPTHLWILRRSCLGDRPAVRFRCEPIAKYFGVFQLSAFQLPRGTSSFRHRGVGEPVDLRQRSAGSRARPNYVQRATPIRRKIESERELHSFAGRFWNSFKYFDGDVFTFIAVQCLRFCDDIS